MKKIFAIILIFIIFIFIYLLQSNIFGAFTIAGIKPNLLLIFALFLGLFLNKIYTPIICFILGLFLDFFTSDIIGINSIMLVIAAVGGMLFTKNFSKDSRITIMIITMAITFICETISYICRLIILHGSIELMAFLKIILIEIVYNILLIIIFYPLIQRFGAWIERVYAEDKILTRYF